jgi:hypothetical protein
VRAATEDEIERQSVDDDGPVSLLSPLPPSGHLH